MRHFKLLLVSSAALLAAACGGGSDTTPATAVVPVVPIVPVVAAATDSRSLNAIVDGLSDHTVPSGTDVPSTVMAHMKYIFDQVDTYGTLMQVGLGDGTTPVNVLDPDTGDKFLPGKLALGLSWVLLDMKAKGDPQYARYLAIYQYITRVMMLKKPGTSDYFYTNDSFGEYYYLIALNRFKDKGMLNEVFSADMQATLKDVLTYKDLFTGAPADYNLNTVSNYYGVAYGIAGLRNRLGWDTDPLTARDDLLNKLNTHYNTRSTEGFSDETDGSGRFDRYSVLLAAEVAERSIEMGNEANYSTEWKARLRKSVDLILPQLNTDGIGFIYGRSIGPYGDTAFVEILTAAAKMGVLTDVEKDVAYAFVQASAKRFMGFWYDPASQSVNMWVKGRGTDAYRGTKRALGENLSLAHQLLYVNERWNQMGYKEKAPMSKADLQAWLDSTQPRYKVTKYDDAVGGYSRAIITIRDGKRSFNLNLVNGAGYERTNPYFPIPYSSGLVSGTADNPYALLTPRLVIAGVTYTPVTYYRNLVVSQVGNVVTVAYDNDGMENVTSGPAKYTNITSRTTYTFEPGVMSRKDVFTNAAAVTITSMQSDFGSYSDMVGSTFTTAAPHVSTFTTGGVYEYSTAGFVTCGLAPFGTVANSYTPTGKLLSNYSCKTTTSQAWTAGTTHETSWKMKYNPLP